MKNSNKKLKIATAQLNFTVGNLEKNAELILSAHKKAEKEKADLIIFSEMALTGYPPEDLVLRPNFQDKAINLLHKIAAKTKNTAIILGSLWREGENLYNAATLLDDGKISNIVAKYNLPNYGVFDEKRVFDTPPAPTIVEFRGAKLGIMICEDVWNNKTAPSLQSQGAEILISINASPFELGKHEGRLKVTTQASCDTSLPLIYVNQIGGQDELVFDGSSFILSENGDVIAQQKSWCESIDLTSWEKAGEKWSLKNSSNIFAGEENNLSIASDTDSDEEKRLSDIYEALKLGLSDYVKKNHFSDVVIGMSGGIDSALTAAIAVDSLGSENVHLVMMPSKYTSQESLDDAEECAKLLSVPLQEVSIEKLVETFDDTMTDAFAGKESDITEENIQSRLRGNILMSLSNKFGYMLLTTGNKSEMAVGYATLYGDMCGGFNILKDIYKTDVFALSKWRNSKSLAIAQNVIEKPPTAELRPDQKDEDSLPPYDILDDILRRLIEEKNSSKQIAESGYAIDVVEHVAKLVKISEYKRFQSPPGVKITKLSFGRDRRYPITNGFKF